MIFLNWYYLLVKIDFVVGILRSGFIFVVYLLVVFNFFLVDLVMLLDGLVFEVGIIKKRFDFEVVF